MTSELRTWRPGTSWAPEIESSKPRDHVGSTKHKLPVLHRWVLRVQLSPGGAQSGLRFLLCMKRGHDCSAGYAFCGSLHVQWGQRLVWEPAVKMGPASLGPEKSGMRVAPAPLVSLLLRVRLWRPWQADLREVSLPSPQRSPRPCGGHHPWVRTPGMYG